jgi:hypothetical protein
VAEVRCPRCKSTQILAAKQGYSGCGGCLGAMLLGPLGILLGFLGSRKVYVSCIACGKQWRPGATRDAIASVVLLSVIIGGCVMLASNSSDRQRRSSPATANRADVSSPTPATPTAPLPTRSPIQKTQEPVAVSTAESAAKSPVNEGLHFPAAVAPDPTPSTTFVPREPEWRVWTASTGNFTITAQFVELQEGKATLKKRDGEEITVPLFKLSLDDRAWIKTHTAGAETPAVKPRHFGQKRK